MRDATAEKGRVGSLGGRSLPKTLTGVQGLVSGTAGTGKSTLAAEFCAAACRRGERALYFAFDESEAQIIRNMVSIGLDQRRWVDEGLLRVVCARPSPLGLEAHLVAMQQGVEEFHPSVVVLDPISDLMAAGISRDVSALLTRQVDFLRLHGITAMSVSLDQRGGADAAHRQTTSLIDVWIQLRMHETNGERNLSLSVLKARGTAHSNQIRELTIGERGIELAEPHGSGEVLNGSARREQVSLAASTGRGEHRPPSRATGVGRGSGETGVLAGAER